MNVGMRQSSEAKTWYRELPASQVDRQVYLAAHTMLRHVKEDLGLAEVEIRWVVEDDPTFAKLDRLLADLARTEPTTFETEPFAGLTRSFHPGTIWVHANLTPREAALTVAHEARHLWQHQRYRPPYTEEERAAVERDAMEYERKAFQAVFGR